MKKKSTADVEVDNVRWIEAKDSILSPEPGGLDITLGINLRSQARWSNNWAAQYGRSNQLRKRVMNAVVDVDVASVEHILGGTPNHLRFVRLAPRLLDTDNLAASFKPIRDQVCCWLAGDNDTSARADDGKRSGYAFEYGQQQQPRVYGVRIEIRRKAYAQ